MAVTGVIMLCVASGGQVAARVMAGLACVCMSYMFGKVQL